jgi:hypothetical protein
MTNIEHVTEFKLRDGEDAIQVEVLVDALNTYLEAIGLQPEEYGFCVSPLITHAAAPGNGRLPKKYRWLVAFAIEGGSEGYYVHVAAIDSATQAYIDLGFAKTYSPDNGYALAREAQRFLTAAAWN